MFTKSKVAALSAELLGTAMLTLVLLAVAFGVGAQAYFVSFAVGIALALVIVLFGRYSGAHFNPAITLALWTVRKVETAKAVLYVAVQLIGGLLAYLLFTYLIDSDAVFAGNELTFDWRILVAEVVGTAVLAFGYAAAVYNKLDNANSAVVIGGAVTVGILIASLQSAALLNPAVAMGAQLWVWTTYVLGPVLGALVAVNLYGLLFAASNTPKSKKASGVKAKK